MIIFVGGLVGAGKSTVARGLAECLGFLYYDLDETKKIVYGRDPKNLENLAAGIAPDMDTKVELYDQAIADITPLLEDHPNIVFDDSLHYRRFRHQLWDAVADLGQEAITIWVRADEEVILERLRAKPRVGHILDDPIPFHEQMLRDFEEFHHSVLMCPNNGDLDDTLDDLISLLRRIGLLLGQFDGPQ